MSEPGQESPRSEDVDVSKRVQREEVSITGDDHIRATGEGALKNPIIRRIAAHTEDRSRLHQRPVQ